MNCRFLWDFFGRDAQKTAEHFLIHLNGFLEREQLQQSTGVEKEAEGHFSAYCDLLELPARANGSAQENDADKVGAALRPNRLVDLRLKD